MYFVDNGSAVPVMPQVKPVSSATPQFFTEGGNGTPPTYPGPDWFNIFQLELLNVLKEAQINPDKANHTQLVTAMKKLFLDASSNGSDIPDKAAFLSNLGLNDVLHKGDGRYLTGTYVNAAADSASIGARAVTGCQFMRAHQAPDAPDQTNYWQIVSLTDVLSSSSAVTVLAISSSTNAFAVGYGTGAGITKWQHFASLEGAVFSGDVKAPNLKATKAVLLGDETGGIAAGLKDGAGFDGNNLEIKSWKGIGFPSSHDDVTRAYIDTALGIIGCLEKLRVGDSTFNKNGDVQGSVWGSGGAAGWLSTYLSDTFPTKKNLSDGLSLKAGADNIKQVGLYQGDKAKPYMLAGDDSGVFMATLDWVTQTFGKKNTAALALNGWFKDTTTGLIVQWYTVSHPGDGTQWEYNFPIPFPNAFFTDTANPGGDGRTVVNGGVVSTTKRGWFCRGNGGSAQITSIAIGY